VVEENERRISRGDNLNNLVKFPLSDKTGRIGPLTPLDESSGNRRTGGPGKLLELCTAGIEVEGGGCMVRKVFFSSHDCSRGAGKSSGCGKLLALVEFASELDHDNHGKFLLSLRGTEFASEKGCVLGLPCLDKTTTDCLSAIPA